MPRKEPTTPVALTKKELEFLSKHCGLQLELESVSLQKDFQSKKGGEPYHPTPSERFAMSLDQKLESALAELTDTRLTIPAKGGEEPHATP